MTEMSQSLNLSGYTAERELLVTRFSRGDRNVFTIPLPLHLIPSHLPKPDPETPFEGNRRVDAAHARKFAIYWRENTNWQTPPVLLDTNVDLTFKPLFTAGGVETGVLSLPHNSGNILDILDGQHRVLGWYYAIEQIGNELKHTREQKLLSQRAEDPVGVAVWRDKIDVLLEQEQRLHKEFLTMELVEGITLAEHKQAFADITVNARGITKSKTVEFDSTSIINRVTRKVAESSDLLSGRVDFEQDRVTGSNPALLSARNVSDIVRHVTLGISGRMNPRREKAFSDDQLQVLSESFFRTLVEAFPQLGDVVDGDMSPSELRKASLLGSPTIIRVLAGTFHDLAIDMDDDMPDYDESGAAKALDFFKSLAGEMDAPVMPGSKWHATGYFPDEGGMAPSSRSQDLKGLSELLIVWARGIVPLWTVPTKNK